MENPKKFSIGVALLLICILTPNASTTAIVSVGALCRNDEQSYGVCDRSKNLQCDIDEEGFGFGGTCACLEGYVFDFDKDYCVTKEEFTNYYGYSKLGSYNQYCNSHSDCSAEMKCITYQCDCPNYCPDGDFIKTDELCYCPTNYKTKLFRIIPFLTVCLFISLLIVCVIKKINAASEEVRQDGTELVILPGTNGSRRVQVPTPQQDANLSLTSDEQQQTINPKSNAPHRLPLNHEQHLRPTAPPQSSSYHQNPPSYSEVMQQQNMI